MKMLWMAPWIALSLASCHSGDIRINSVRPEDGNNQFTPSAGSDSTADHTTSPHGGSLIANPEDPTIYFHRVTMKSGFPFKVVGVGFLDASASSTTAFGVRFPQAEPLRNLPLIHAIQGGVVYRRSETPALDGLFSVSPSTLETAEVAHLPRGISSYAVSADLEELAWIDETGGAYVLPRSTHSPQLIDLKGSLGRSIEMGSNSLSVFIHLADRSGIHEEANYSSTIKIENPNLTLEATRKVIGFPFASSPSGARTASGMRTGTHSEIRVVDRDPARESTIQIESGEIFDLKWRDEQSLSFRVKLPSGHQLLMLADVSTQEVQTIAEISHTPTGNPIESDIICPTWHRNQLYFADSYQSTFAIYRAKRTESGWTVDLFARTRTENEGFICPTSNNSKVFP